MPKGARSFGRALSEVFSSLSSEPYKYTKATKASMVKLVGYYAITTMRMYGI